MNDRIPDPNRPACTSIDLADPEQPGSRAAKVSQADLARDV
jgi:hypothetical protein